jgi:hypothetical protein
MASKSLKSDHRLKLSTKIPVSSEVSELILGGLQCICLFIIYLIMLPLLQTIVPDCRMIKDMNGRIFPIIPDAFSTFAGGGGGAEDTRTNLSQDCLSLDWDLTTGFSHLTMKFGILLAWY